MRNKLVEFDVEVNDILTPLSCSSMIIEFIKYIIYQKQLIPYPYERLKMYVDKRRSQIESNEKFDGSESSCRNDSSKYCIISDKYFKKTQDVCTSLENIFNLIKEELTTTSHDKVEEIVVLLGMSFLNPQDVFRICIPSLNYSHLDKNHSTRKNWRNLFRTIINSEQFYELTSNTCTSNMHILLKMKQDHSTNSSLFIPRNGFKLPTKGNHAIISFKSAIEEPDCSCFKLKIFEDDSNCSILQSEKNDHPSELMMESENNSSSGSCCWYQMKDTVRYFSDVNINGTSVTDIWMNPSLLHSL